MVLPRIGEIWKHHKDNLYVIIAIANSDCGNKQKFPLTIVYRQAATDKIFARPWEEFKLKFSKEYDV